MTIRRFSITRHLRAVLAAGLLLVLPAGSAFAAVLTKDQIASQIIDKTLNAKRMGLSVKILYKSDGTVTMKFPLLSGAGTWSWDGDGICMMLTSGPRQGKTCVTFEHLGDNRYRNSEGIEFSIATP